MDLGRLRAGMLLGCAALCWASGAVAQGTPPGFNAFKHVRWGADEGAPNGVHHIAQSGDGSIWLAGDGLYRFEGTTFERVEWPVSEPWKRLDPISLMVGAGGELWVGLGGKPGVAIYRGGRLVSAGMPDPPGPITAMAQSPDGTLWFASSRRGGQVRRLRHGRWDALTLPDGGLMGMVATRDGRVWVALTREDGRGGTVAVLPRGASHFVLLPDRIGSLPRLTLDTGGALWVSDRDGTRMLADATGARPPRPVTIAAPSGIRSATASFDLDGGLWRTSEANGLSYVPGARGGRASSFTALNGLTSDYTYDTLVDREGSVWIATEGGLDQFRRASATQEPTIPPDPVNGLAIARARDGSVYIQSGDRLFHIAPGAAPRQVARLGAAALAMCAARDGGVWIVQPTRTMQVRAGHVETWPSYAGGAIPINCAQGKDGRLWVSRVGAPLVWRDGAGWHGGSGWPGQQRAWEVVATRSGDIAFNGLPKLGTLRGDTMSLRGKYGTATMLAAGGEDVFLSDVQGLVRLRGGQVARLDDRRFPWLVWLRGLVRTGRGETWLVARGGLYRVATADLDRAFADRAAALPYRFYDTQDGLVSAAQHAGFKGTQIVEGGDGRLWFLNRQGAAFIDPARLTPNRLAPPVAIRSLASGGAVWHDPARLALAAGTRALDIGYAGLSFVVPQRVRFRYRLEGVDAGWVEAGTRHLATYTNLGPGTYRFRVIAANGDGVWNRAGAALDVEIPPTFVQGLAFKLLCAGALIALLWAAYVLRLRVVAGRIRLGMTARFEERERIARELHDTLLQGIQSLTLRFQRVVNELPPQQPAHGTLLLALDVADRVIAEGRDRVQDLRSRRHDALAPLLREMVAQQPFEPGVRISMSESGGERCLAPLAFEEIGRIAREALVNIHRHAQATCVLVQIRNGRQFVLRIVDDGVGIDPATAAAGKTGHFGLCGMHERARKLRAQLVLRPLADHGTELVLTVPGRVAYLPEPRTLWARLRREP